MLQLIAMIPDSACFMSVGDGVSYQCSLVLISYLVISGVHWLCSSMQFSIT